MLPPKSSLHCGYGQSRQNIWVMDAGMRMLFHNLNGTFPLTLIVRVGGKLLCQLFFGFIWFSWYELGGFLGVEGLDRKIGVRGQGPGVRKGGAGVSAGWRKARGVVAAAAIKAKSVVPAAPALRSPTPSEQARRGPRAYGSAEARFGRGWIMARLAVKLQ